MAIGVRVTKVVKYYENSKYGCILRFHWDINLTEQYYLDNFANTNRTMQLCAPDVPIDVEQRQLYKKYNTLVHCFTYEIGALEWRYTYTSWSHSWKYFRLDLLITLSILGIIAITGAVGQ